MGLHFIKPEKVHSRTRGALSWPPVPFALLPTPCIPAASDEFLLPDHFPTASKDRFPLLSERDAPAKEVCTADEVKVKENQEKDKIGSKPDKNRKRVEAGKSLKQLQ
nr:hypothetical protein [Tanacetum cinerariifolium]